MENQKKMKRQKREAKQQCDKIFQSKKNSKKEERKRERE
jgi:hypothetical protein